MGLSKVGVQRKLCKLYLNSMANFVDMSWFYLWWLKSHSLSSASGTCWSYPSGKMEPPCVETGIKLGIKRTRQVQTKILPAQVLLCSCVAETLLSLSGCLTILQCAGFWLRLCSRDLASTAPVAPSLADGFQQMALRSLGLMPHTHALPSFERKVRCPILQACGRYPSSHQCSKRGWRKSVTASALMTQNIMGYNYSQWGFLWD